MTRNKWNYYLFVLPILLFFAVFMAYPLLNTLYLGFFEWNGVDKDMQFIGLANYRSILSDPIFLKAFLNFFIYAFAVIVLEMIAGFALAYLTRRKFFVNNLFRAIIFFPVVMLPIVISYVFKDILSFSYGILNTALRSIGLNSLALDWLANPNIALTTVIVITAWSGTGFAMSVYSSALSALPQETLEAARIDGANRFQIVTRVVWPMLRGTHFTLTILSAVSALKIFDLIYLLTGGGPLHSTEMPSTYMYDKAFVQYEQGLASAVATLMILFALIITLIQMRLSAKKD